MPPCPKCGYVSEGTECPSCGVIFAKLAARPQRPAPTPQTTAASFETRPFNVLFVSALTPDRQYRVYCKPGAIYLIRFGGQPIGIGSIVAKQLGGVVGEAIYNGLPGNGTGLNRDKKLAELDQQDLEALLPDHKHNLRINLAEVERSTLEAPSFLGAHGRHLGRWSLELRGGKSMLFQIQTAGDGALAEPQLTAVLGTRLTRKARWDAGKGVFVKA